MNNSAQPRDAGRSVLIVDDEAGMRAALEISFRREGWEVGSARGTLAAIALLQQKRPELVVTDIRMPHGDGFDVMRAAHKLWPGTAVILLTAFASVPDAVNAIKSGACEYLVKPVAFDQLLETAERLLGARSAPAGNYGFVGSSASLQESLEKARIAATSDADILIEAESGTGKELLARMIHNLSTRCEQPLIAVNCAGIPESLLESELFGFARGAFTGAVAPQSGKFQLADGGTLLLDEVGEMPLNLQPKLLRALQEREFYRLGESRPVRVDIRVIATTNRPLAKMVQEGSFRADLYYRLNVVPLSLPPLRERREDIRELAYYFATKFAPADAGVELPEPLLDRLEKHSWPGNVRELANTVRRLVALRTPGFAFEPLLNLPSDSAPPKSLSGNATWLVPSPARVLEPGISLQEMEKRLFRLTLDATRGNRSRTAEMLGVSLRTVRNKIREYNLPAREEYAHGND